MDERLWWESRGLGHTPMCCRLSVWFLCSVCALQLLWTVYSCAPQGTREQQSGSSDAWLWGVLSELTSIAIAYLLAVLMGAMPCVYTCAKLHGLVRVVAPAFAKE